MNGDRIGVGIVGLSARGHWAATAHVPALRSLAGFELRGLTASTPESAKAAAEKFGVPFHSDQTRELVERPEIDLVVVAVKLPAHRELVTAALEAGKMVYCEWPLGKGLAEAEELAALAASRGVRGWIGLQARAAPAVRYLRDLVAAGYVGEVLSTSVIASSGPPWDGRASRDSTYLLDKNNGATMLSIPFAHSVDALCWMLGDFTELSATVALRSPRAKIAETGETVAMSSPDQVAVHGVLAGGAVASIHYRGALSRGGNFLWEINGRDGDLVVTGDNGHLQYGRIKIRGGQGKDRSLAELPLPASYRLLDLPPEDLACSVGHAYRNLLADIREGSQLVPSFDDALVAHRMVEAIATAAQTGQRQHCAARSK